MEGEVLELAERRRVALADEPAHREHAERGMPRLVLVDAADELRETLNANQQLGMLHRFGPKYGLDADAVVQSMHALEQWPLINGEPYMHTVMPNLRRLGLITERTEAKYRERGMLLDERVPGAAAAAWTA